MNIVPWLNILLNVRSSHLEVFLGKSVLKLCSKFTREHPIPKYDFNKVAKQLYWNHTSAWAFCCKFVLLLFSKQPFIRTPLDGCFWMIYNFNMIIPMHISNRFVIICNIRIVIRILKRKDRSQYYKFDSCGKKSIELLFRYTIY